MPDLTASSKAMLGFHFCLLGAVSSLFSPLLLPSTFLSYEHKHAQVCSILKVTSSFSLSFLLLKYEVLKTKINDKSTLLTGLLLHLWITR